MVLLVASGCRTVPNHLLTDELTTGAYRQILNETVWIPSAVYGCYAERENRTATAVRTLLWHDLFHDKARARKTFAFSHAAPHNCETKSGHGAAWKGTSI